MKLIQLFALITLVVLLAPFVSLGQVPLPEQTPPPEIPTNFFGCLPTDTLRTCLLRLLGTVLRVLLVVALAFAAIMIAWAGITYIMSPDKKDDAKNRIIYAAVGLVIAFLAWVGTFLLSRIVGTGVGV